ncbi:histidine phosphatase family protein [Streptomyces sp. NBC_00201]|uniref:SixA phosphatase family protein n=1 Tax=unclassified Streptomyces TaxID=2593676 RepID=UPI002255D365|nr:MULTISPECIES: histidine phosphatase family protein [unclassified Streptomyces]MCX5058111.1 histidine phosphatase family protein [Streptomyces sp. NBC_00452]MCX5245009.1 histidine phosphatase family protein [Streptomyces sp. NBC_00201]MCX5289259.1 histidine phosphatase family protein [Streptomyces sp. NBC_00183]
MSVAEPRRIVLFRHAKADWPQVADHERPLAERGRSDAAVSGRKLVDTGIPFDLALCSTSVRTRETWKLAVHEFAHRPKTVYEERIYEASPGELIALLNEVPDDAQNVVLIGHNPGVQGLAEVLAGSAEGDTRERMNRLGFPAAAFAVLSFESSWKSLEPAVATLLDYWAPTE